MNGELEGLLRQYEEGQLSRRAFLGALATLMTVGREPTAVAAAQPIGPIGPIEQLNHVTMFVPDVERSVAFYRRVLGMPVLTRQDPGINLDAGSGFLGVYPSGTEEAGTIHHFCLGMRDFDAASVVAKLAEHGVEASIRRRGETEELYFVDPDGVRVQLQDTRYRGGVGVLGDRDPE